MFLNALRGYLDGLGHDEHEHGAVYETAARIGDATGRLIDRALRIT